MKALYAGSFDPVTFGHLDIINRAAAIVEDLVVGVGVNPEKTPWIYLENRVQILKQELENYPKCSVESFRGLTVSFAEKIGASILIRGIRGAADLEYEMYVARLNKKLSGIETIFLAPSDQYLVLSSTYVRQIWELGRNADLLKNLVPESVIDYLKTVKT